MFLLIACLALASWFDAIFIAFLDVCAVSEVISHFIIFVSVVSSDPMKAHFCHAALAFVIQRVKVGVKFRCIGLAEYKNRILAVGIYVNYGVFGTRVNRAYYCKHLHSVVGSSHCGMAFYLYYFFIFQYNVGRATYF